MSARKPTAPPGPPQVTMDDIARVFLTTPPAHKAPSPPAKKKPRKPAK